MSVALPIVLTGTITPRAIYTAHADPGRRRQEYLDAVRYYARHAPVHFLENSGFRFAQDAEFAAVAGASYFEHPPSDDFDKGKGYQEFEMLDAWVARVAPTPARPGRFLKITGRYIVRNIAQVLDDCARATSARALVERKLWPRHSARTDVAMFETAFYEAHVAGLYRECDDSRRVYLENVVRRRLEGVAGIEVFPHYPVKTGMNGSKGIPLPGGPREDAKIALRDAFYRLNRGWRFF